MKYILEISDINGDCLLAAPEYASIESDTPIPIPSVGDAILLGGGAGPDGDRSILAKVVRRQFSFFPTDRSDTTAQVQVFCEVLEGGK